MISCHDAGAWFGAFDAWQQVAQPVGFGFS
jgi:hypothetical protein